MTDDKNSEPDVEDVELDEPNDDDLESDEETEAVIADVPQELTESEDNDGDNSNGGT